MSFKDTLNETREILRKSNRQNLAHAYLEAEEKIAEFKEQIKKWEALLKEIEANGDESEWIDQNSANKVRELYNRAHQDWLK